MSGSYQLLEKFLLEKRFTVDVAVKPIFMLGAPRTGSTVLYQIVVNNFNLFYISNFINDYFSQYPMTGGYLDRLLNPRATVSYQSYYGKTAGQFEPSEGSQFFKFWYGGRHPSEIYSKDILSEKRAYIQKVFQYYSNISNRPLIFKNAWNCFRIKNILEMFPSSIFIWVRRDVEESAKSDLVARYRRGGGHVWNSATTKDFLNIQKRPFCEQVVEQQLAYNKTIQRDLLKYAASRYIEVWYEDVVVNCQQELGAIDSFFKDKGLDVAKNPLKRISSEDVLKSRISKKLGQEDDLKVKEYVLAHPDIVGHRYETKKSNSRDSVSTSNNVIDIKDLSILAGGGEKLKILMLADVGHQTLAVQDHIEGIVKYSNHEIDVLNSRKSPDLEKRISWDLYDGIIIHYSISIVHESYLSQKMRCMISKFEGFKIQFIQDEYRYINRMIQEIQYLGVDGLFSSLSLENINNVYNQKSLSLGSVIKISCLPGYISEKFLSYERSKIIERTTDVVYRSRDLPFNMGVHGRDKHRIGNGMLNCLKGTDLKYDIELSDCKRIYGDDWIGFVQGSKTILGVEGGSSIFDFDGTVARQIEEFIKENEQVDFSRVFKNVLHLYEGNVVHKTITPRSFEAMVLGTVQILFEGDYRGVLQPGRHYIELKRDFSNEGQVLSMLKDHDQLQLISDTAYDEIVQSGDYHYSILGKGVDGLIGMIT